MTVPNFRPTANVDTLTQRAELLRRTRKFFDELGFVEVQTPLLSADTVVDRHLDPIPVLVPSDPTDPYTGREMFLQTSPEFLMKRLLAAGMTAIYQICPAFRVGEVGDQHNPEFTMLEWYRCGDDMRAGMELLGEFTAAILECPKPIMVSMQAAFTQYAGYDPFRETAAELRERVRSASISVPDSIEEDDWDSWFEILFAEHVQPHLGVGTPHIIYHYPASQAALARTSPIPRLELQAGSMGDSNRSGDDGVYGEGTAGRSEGIQQSSSETRPEITPECSSKSSSASLEFAERFELFVEGVELANGYHELLDPDELRQRNREVNRQRAQDGKPTLPEDSRLLQAMESGLPACSGVAVGFDRLVTLALGQTPIRRVISFPIDRA